MASLYRELDAAIVARGPMCRNRGECCRFERFGHRLFVTSAELAYFLSGGAETVHTGTADDRCPYQMAGACAARERRPAGCRIFYCDPAQTDWQGPLTEETLLRLRGIHARHGLPYAYVEWLTALRALAV
jgi:hypothetical protein